MPNTLIFHYRPGQLQDIDYISRNNLGQLSEVESLSLETLAEKARDQQCIALLDSSVINISQLHLPTQNRQRQLQAVPFALEDQIASDIEETHFALAQKQTGNQLVVASIKKEILDSILEQFDSVGLFLDTLLPDVLALPFQDNTWTLLIDQQHALIKASPLQGYYVDRDNLTTLFSELIKTADHNVDHVLILHTDDDIHATDLIDPAGMALSVEIYESAPLGIFAQNLQHAQQLNLLQGEYARKKQSDLNWLPWRFAASLAATWMILQMAVAVMETGQLKQKNLELSRQIEQQFKQAVPDARKFTGMRTRMKNRLKQLKTGTGSDSPQVFLDILIEAAPALAGNDKVTINGIVYRNKHLDLELQTDSLQNLESIKNKLAAIRGIKTILSTSVEKNTVKGRLRLEIEG